MMTRTLLSLAREAATYVALYAERNRSGHAPVFLKELLSAVEREEARREPVVVKSFHSQDVHPLLMLKELRNAIDSQNTDVIKSVCHLVDLVLEGGHA